MTIQHSNLIITADDAGYCDGIDIAVAELVSEGILTRVAAFANFRRLHSLVDRLDSTTSLGLHVNLSSGRPLSCADLIPSLVTPSGLFHSPTPSFRGQMSSSIESFIASQVPLFAASDIHREVQEQIDEFARVAGFPPSFACVHHDLDRSPHLLDVLSSMSELPPTRQMLLRQHVIVDVAMPFLSPTTTADDAALTLWQMVSSAIDTSARANGSVVEIVCHPAYPDAALTAFTVYRSERFVELQAWRDSRVRDQLQSGIRVQDILTVPTGVSRSSG